MGVTGGMLYMEVNWWSICWSFISLYSILSATWDIEQSTYWPSIIQKSYQTAKFESLLSK